MLKRSLIINAKDNVAVLLEPAAKGDSIKPEGIDREITLTEDVEFAHKAALVDLSPGDKVYKYGEEIGYMLAGLSQGGWVHNHNMGCDRGVKAKEGLA